MTRHLSVSDEVLQFLKDALQERKEQFEEYQKHGDGDYSEADLKKFHSNLQTAHQALNAARSNKVHQFPEYNGEWGFIPQGKDRVESLMYIEGVTAPGVGYVNSDLGGIHEGRSVSGMLGTWREVITLCD